MYSKTCVKSRSKVLQNAPKHSVILSSFIKLPFVINLALFCLFLSGHLTQILLYYAYF